MIVSDQTLLTLIECHEKTMELAIQRGQTQYHKRRYREEFVVMGLAGEVGEVANLYKKKMRGREIDDREIDNEISDVLSYLLVLAHERRIDLDTILAAKLEVYKQRMKDGLI